MKCVISAICACAVLMLACLAGSAQQNAELKEEVAIPTLVLDRAGIPVTGLTAVNFRVLENGGEQTITHVSLENDPLSLAVILDASASRKDRLIQGKETVSRFWRATVPTCSC